MRRVAVLVGSLFALAVAGIAAANYVSLGRPLARVLESDGRNTGISASAHFGRYIDTSVLVFDLEGVSPTSAPIDVFRTLLQYAAAVKDKRYSRVELAHRGTTRFVMAGEYFAQLGTEYRQQNPMYTMRTFAEHLYRPDGQRAYGEWSGGIFGVLQKQMEDFSDFHREWYME
jgi:hypothetical protein